MEWGTAYQTEKYTLWEDENPSSELVGMIATQGEVRDNTALDIGCGAGREAIFLKEAGYHVIGVDISEEALVIAKKRSNELGISIDWRVGDARNIPVESNSIDFINDRGCFHIICERDRDTYAKEIYRVLKPEGTFLLRGCRQHLQTESLQENMKEVAKECPFKPITKEVIKRHFPRQFFTTSPLYRITLFGKENQIPGNLIYLRKVKTQL